VKSAIDADALHTFNRLKYANLDDDAFGGKKGVLRAFPEPPESTDAFDTQQQAILLAQVCVCVCVRARVCVCVCVCVCVFCSHALCTPHSSTLFACVSHVVMHIHSRHAYLCRSLITITNRIVSFKSSDCVALVGMHSPPPSLIHSVSPPPPPHTHTHIHTHATTYRIESFKKSAHVQQLLSRPCRGPLRRAWAGLFEMTLRRRLRRLRRSSWIRLRPRCVNHFHLEVN
jgi:hypothetical protein